VSMRRSAPQIAYVTWMFLIHIEGLLEGPLLFAGFGMPCGFFRLVFPNGMDVVIPTNLHHKITATLTKLIDSA
jgi:hypothetical protein